MQKLLGLLNERNVALGLVAVAVDEAMEALASFLEKTGTLDGPTARKLGRTLAEREKESPTAIGEGVAVPHAYMPELTEPVFVLGRFDGCIDFRALDAGENKGKKKKEEVDIVFLLAGPPKAQKKHLMLLARIARLAHDAQWLKDIRKAASPAEVMAAVKAVEKRHV